MRTRLLRCCTLTAMLLVLAGCAIFRDPSQPIPTVLIPAPQAANRLVVVLPGKGDSLKSLKRSGVAEAIQRAWPDADVVLALLSMPYYKSGEAMPRLRNEVIAPARHRYKQVWLTGASLGGMGSILYDTYYPNQLDGIVVLAPYLGDKPILKEIEEAGGIAAWNPGPPQKLADKTWQHEMWRHIKGWSGNPAARRVWLAYGDDDKFRETIPMMEPALLNSHVIIEPGKHKWKTWTPLMEEVLQAQSREPALPPLPPGKH
jgi:pimeloyl-ACP methyl ester carboxylesterase